MKEYIEREAVLNEAQEVCYWCGYENRYDEFVSVEDVRAIPAADVVERKRGEWREECVAGFCKAFCTVFVCSACGKRYNTPCMNFCPNCGADMRGEKHEAD